MTFKKRATRWVYVREGQRLSPFAAYALGRDDGFEVEMRKHGVWKSVKEKKDVRVSYELGVNFKRQLHIRNKGKTKSTNITRFTA